MNLSGFSKWWHFIALWSVVFALLPPLSVRADSITEPLETTGPSSDLDQEDSFISNQLTAPRVATIVDPDVVYYHHDTTGNLMAMTDESGQVVWHADVRPFGQGTANPPDRPLRFVNKPREEDNGAEGGLYHLGARVYDPLTGRFLSPDPFLLTNIPRGEPQRFNLYAYGLNNPYRYQDPYGTYPPDVTTSTTADFPFQRDDSVISEGLGPLDYLIPLGSAAVSYLAKRAVLKAGTVAAEKAASLALAKEGGELVAERSGSIAVETLAKLSGKDAQIIAQAIKSTKAGSTFSEHLTALAQATSEIIPGGQVSQLGIHEGSRVFGSQVSGIGIVEINGVTTIIKMSAGKLVEIVGPFR